MQQEEASFGQQEEAGFGADTANSARSRVLLTLSPRVTEASAASLDHALGQAAYEPYA
jgi:hypothetical protein